MKISKLTVVSRIFRKLSLLKEVCKFDLVKT